MPRSPGTILLKVEVGFSDGGGATWRLQGQLELTVAQAAGEDVQIGDISLAVDGSVVRAPVSIQIGGTPTRTPPPTDEWLQLPVRLLEHRPRVPRPGRRTGAAAVPWLVGGGLASALLIAIGLRSEHGGSGPASAHESGGDSPAPDDMAAVPAGWFWMGCVEGEISCDLNEKPAGAVWLDEFWMDRFEVTVEDYRACVEARWCSRPKYVHLDPAYKFDGWSPGLNYGKSGREHHPVNGVTWFQSRKYCKWRGMLLPTEAQWEKSARGGCDSKDDCGSAARLYPWGPEEPTCERAVINEGREGGGGVGCGTGRTEPVGSRPAGRSRPVGAHDMIGNVVEWTLDAFDPDFYAPRPERNPLNDSTSRKVEGLHDSMFTPRTIRGGGYARASARGLRISWRTGLNPSSGHHEIGFRCASASPPD